MHSIFPYILTASLLSTSFFTFKGWPLKLWSKRITISSISCYLVTTIDSCWFFLFITVSIVVDLFSLSKKTTGQIFGRLALLHLNLLLAMHHFLANLQQRYCINLVYILFHNNYVLTWRFMKHHAGFSHDVATCPSITS